MHLNAALFGLHLANNNNERRGEGGVKMTPSPAAPNPQKEFSMLPDHETTQHHPKLDALLGIEPAKRRGGRPKGSFKKPPTEADAHKESRRDQRRRLEQNIPSPVMSVEETALYMRVSEQTIYDDANAGKLPHIRKGKRILIIKPLLDEMIFNEARDRWAKVDAPRPSLCTQCGR